MRAVKVGGRRVLVQRGRGFARCQMLRLLILTLFQIPQSFSQPPQQPRPTHCYGRGTCIQYRCNLRSCKSLEVRQHQQPGLFGF